MGNTNQQRTLTLTEENDNFLCCASVPVHRSVKVNNPNPKNKKRSNQFEEYKVLSSQPSSQVKGIQELDNPMLQSCKTVHFQGPQELQHSQLLHSHSRSYSLSTEQQAWLKSEKKKRQDLRTRNIRATYLDTLGLPPACCSQPNHNGIHVRCNVRGAQSRESSNIMSDYIDGASSCEQYTTEQSYRIGITDCDSENNIGNEHDKSDPNEVNSRTQMMTQNHEENKERGQSTLDVIQEVNESTDLTEFQKQKRLKLLDLDKKPLISSSGNTPRKPKEKSKTKVSIKESFLVDDDLKETIQTNTQSNQPILIDIEDSFKVITDEKKLVNWSGCGSGGRCCQCNTINCQGPKIDFTIKLKDNQNFKQLSTEGLRSRINIEELKGIISTRSNSSKVSNKLRKFGFSKQVEEQSTHQPTESFELKKIPHRASQVTTDNDLQLQNTVQHPPCLQLNFSHVDHLQDEKEHGQQKLVLKKTNQQIRAKLLSSLTYNKIWLMPDSKPQQYQTCIIFDWDDTIFCTTFLEPYQNIKDDSFLSSSKQKKLRDLDEQASKMLKLAKTKGQVIIVTNATYSWVEYSAIRFMPLVYEQIAFDIPIISAREKFGPVYPTQMEKWKILAFLELQEQLNKDAILNIIALGDQDFEMDAAYHLGTQFSHAFVKTVKFRVAPGPKELTQQIKLVMEQFDTICNSAKDLKVKLMKEQVCCNNDKQEIAQNCPMMNLSSGQTSSKKISSAEKVKSKSRKKKKENKMFQKRSVFY